MSYHFSKTVELSFEKAIVRVTEELKKEGFGIITEIDIKETLKKKIDMDFRKYMILGACNPIYAYKALNIEDKIGTMLPCNVVVQEHKNGKIEISAVDPVASMSAIKNEALQSLALEIQTKLKNAIAKV